MKPLEKADFTRDDKGNYTGPRGEQVIRGTDGKAYRVFICHGCQSRWQMSEDGETVTDMGPHALSPLKEVTETGST